MKYNKLVRDKIIEIIEEKGDRASYHLASDEEYRKKLNEKLLEEVKEFLVDQNKEEMADVFEVIVSLLKLNNWNEEEILLLQKEKREKRGGFDKRIILEES